MNSKKIIIGSHYWNNRSNTLERCFHKLIKQHGWNWNRNMSGYIFLVYLAVLFFQKKIKINDDTTSRLYIFKIKKEESCTIL